MFTNPHMPSAPRRIKDFFFWLIGIYHDGDVEKVPDEFNYPLPKQEFDPNRPWAMWINHSTYLVSWEGRHLLTDPIWSSRCSPVPFLGPKRKHPPALKIEELPKIDYVLISHDHYDHLDIKTIHQLAQRFPDILWIVPHGVKKWFLGQGLKKVVELSWWQEIDIDSLFRITSVPAQHFSGRTLFSSTLWCGWVMEDLLSSRRLYFVGDTGYNPSDFKQIGEKWKSMDLALIPIGAYKPRAFMAPVHISPKEAVKIHQEVGSTLSLGMHWKTFRLGDEKIHQPPFDLFMAMQQENLNPETFLAPNPGERINW